MNAHKGKISVATVMIMIHSLFCIAGSAFAAPPSGANNDAMDAIMNSSAKTSGNTATYNEYMASHSTPGYWIDYLNTEWQKCRDRFTWSDTSDEGLPLWDGTASGTTTAPNSTAPGLPGNESMQPFLNGTTYEVWTGQQLRYAFQKLSASTQYTIKLMRNIDLNGYNQNWGRVTTIKDATVVLDGNGKTIYNLGLNTSLMFDKLTNSVLENLTFKSVKCVSTGTHAVSIFLTFTNVTAHNISIENSLFFNNTPALTQNTAPLASNFVSTASTLDNCGVKNTDVYGVNHVGGFVAIPGNAVIKNCFAIDGTVISVGGHSGGFISCNDYVCTVTNCFTNNRVLGASQTGGFEGYSAQTNYKNCYASGSVEGFETLGGFVALVSSRFGSPYDTFTNCYSTTIVGMQNGGKKLGGFVGEIRGASPVFTNCYAAGEVGALDTDVSENRTSHLDVGGFFGLITDAGTTKLDHCYYDKQTTALREWASGSDKTVSGITGVYTTETLKSGIKYQGLSSEAGENGFNGFTTVQANEWLVSSDGMYPQLMAFLNADTFLTPYRDLVRAYSKASVSTVHLNTWEKDFYGNALRTTTYDTVRDITVRFPMTSDGQTAWTQDGLKTQLLGKDYPVLTLEKTNGVWYADHFAPGIEWLQVNTTIDGAVGSRRLRIIPTVNLSAGENKSVGPDTSYDHADDVWLVFSTGARMADSSNRDVSVGIYPDIPMNVDQQAAQGAVPPNFAEANDKFTKVNMNHMSKGGDNALGSTLETLISPVESVDPDTGMLIKGPELPLRSDPDPDTQEKWNGYKRFEAADAGHYLVEYYWNLADGRYVRDSKLIHVLANAELSVRVINDDEDHTQNDMALQIDAYELPDGVDLHTAGADRANIAYATPGAVSFKVNDTDMTEIVGFTARVYGGGQQAYILPETLTGDLDGQSFTLPYTYLDMSYNDSGQTYGNAATVEKKYTITKDGNGVYQVKFDQSSGDINGVIYEDMERNIEVTLIVHVTAAPDTGEPEQPETDEPDNPGEPPKAIPETGDASDVLLYIWIISASFITWFMIPQKSKSKR